MYGKDEQDEDNMDSGEAEYHRLDVVDNSNQTFPIFSRGKEQADVLTIQQK